MSSQEAVEVKDEPSGHAVVSTTTITDSATKQLASTFQHVVTDSHVYFWHAPSFGNFTLCPFEMRGQHFNCSEQAFMWMKAKEFNDDDTADKILQEQDPGTQKALAKLTDNFDETVWEARRYDIMVEVLQHKFEQNQDYAQALIDTDNKILVEASSQDGIWGVRRTAAECIALGERHSRWKGLNLLGKALMQVREVLQKRKTSR